MRVGAVVRVRERDRESKKEKDINYRDNNDTKENMKYDYIRIPEKYIFLISVCISISTPQDSSNRHALT